MTGISTMQATLDFIHRGDAPVARLADDLPLLVRQFLHMREEVAALSAEVFDLRFLVFHAVLFGAPFDLVFVALAPRLEGLVFVGFHSLGDPCEEGAGVGFW